MLSRLFKHLQWRWRMLCRIYWPQFWLARFLPSKIQAGPFMGMAYNKAATGSVVLPKLVGSYEAELHPVLAALPMEDYETCIDVGAGEGYYAVGMAWRYPSLCVVAFETTRRGQQRIRALAIKNNVARQLEIHGWCDPQALQTALSHHSRNLLILDVEGYEEVLLDPEEVLHLQSTDFIVEVHPEHNANLAQVITQRFETSHIIETIPQQPNKHISALVKLPPALKPKAQYLTNEFRGPQFWMLGRAKQHIQI